jgi:hypothetical protein
VPDLNGTYLIRPAYKHPQNRVLNQASAARHTEKIVGGRDAAIEHSLENKNGRIYSVFFQCAWQLMLLTKI